jgi:predicted  nucleic acid-binding Zn-ribbon protein
MATIASLLVKIMGDSSQLSDSLKKATDKMQTFGDSATAIGQTLSTRLTLPLVAFATIAVREFGKEEDAIARLNGALKANAGQSGITASEIKALAESLEATTNVTADATMSAAALLSTFHQVSNQAGENNDVFTRTIKISADLAALMGTDMTSATMQLAKALENPTIGLGALSRSGTTFTEQQKEMIKSLVDSGNQLEAQTMILDVVESQYKGIAEELAKTTSGRIKNAINELGKTVDSFGQIISEAIAPIIEMVTRFAQGLDGMDESTKRFVVTLGAFAAGIGPVVYGVGLLTSGIRALTIAMANNPYTALAIGILAIGTAAYMALSGTDDLNKKIRESAGLSEKLTGSQDEYNKILATQNQYRRDLIAIDAKIASEKKKNKDLPADLKSDISTLLLQRDAIVKNQDSVKALGREWYSARDATNDAKKSFEGLKESLGGTTTELVAQAGSIGALSKELEGLQAQFEATASGTERAKFADKIRELEERITVLRSVLKPVITELKMLNEMGMAGDIGFAGEEFDSKYEGLPMVTDQMRLLADASFFANQMALEFTNSFSAGLANLLVHGGKIEHMLRNIGNLLASSALQLGIQMLLMGATGSGGAFGYIKGLIGGLFAPSASMGDMGGVTPASASLTLDGQFQIRGTDLVYVMNRAERSLR